MNTSKSWPVGIAIIYISFVLLLVTFVIISSFQPVELVTDDYYDKELKYQQQINRMARAKSLSKPVAWDYDKRSNSLTLQFPQEFGPEQVKGTILFFRPSDAKQDKLVAINLNSENRQFISTKNLTPGFWKLKIFWQTNKTDYYKESILVVE